MCLAIPGKVTEVERDETLGIVKGKVSFGGVVRAADLTYTPDVSVGDYVIVHVGFALSKLDAAEAEDLLRTIAEMAAMGEEIEEMGRQAG